MEKHQFQQASFENSKISHHYRREVFTPREASQIDIFLNYLQKHVATASMVSLATGIPQKNICRYKRKLEKRGLIYEAMVDKCGVTGRVACYLATSSTCIKS